MEMIENKGVQREQSSFASKKSNNEDNKRQARIIQGKKFPGINPLGIRPPYPRHPNRRPPTRKPTPRRPPIRRTTPRRPPARRTTPRRPPIRKITPRRPPIRRTTPRKPPNGRPTTKKPGPRPTPPKKTTPKKPPPRPSVRPPVRPPLRPETSKPTNTTTERTTTTTKRTTTTIKSDKYADLKSQLIKDINDLRSKHWAPALTFDQILAERAQKIADKFKEKPSPFIERSDAGLLVDFSRSKKEYGPLIFWTKGSEHINYDNLEDEPVSDFIQLIWVKTTKIGCSISEIDPKGSLLTICLLTPKGNIQGQYDENVHRPIQ
uniref:SCP domain-containing protein n=1 Tax=Strongyloides papillosus TaxID=174720 RepID=A0A0N5BHJ8_STREA